MTKSFHPGGIKSKFKVGDVTIHNIMFFSFAFSKLMLRVLANVNRHQPTLQHGQMFTMPTSTFWGSPGKVVEGDKKMMFAIVEPK